MASKSSPSRRETTERKYIAGYDESSFSHPSVAVDLVLMTVEVGSLRALLLKRREHPARGRWALPGGFVGLDESLDEAAARVLRQKAGLNGVFVEQLYTFGQPERDPRTRVISVAYFALVPAETLRRAIGFSGDEPLALATLRIPWVDEQGGPVEAVDDRGSAMPLAFDHAQMLGMAVKRLRGRLRYSPIAFELVGNEFTLRGLQVVHTAILGRPTNKDAFRRSLLASGQLESTGRLEKSVGHRPAEFYRFRPRPVKGRLIPQRRTHG